MKKSDFLNDISKKLCDALPPSAQKLKKDIEKNFHVILKATFSKLDLVTRDEFNAQTKVLARSRKKIESLESRITELEKLIEENDS